MFHSRINPGAGARAITTGELTLRTFLYEHEAALGNAAALLARRHGVRLINAIRDGLGQPGPLTARLRRHLLDLRRVLFLEHTDDWEAADFDALLEPEDPIVSEICLLAEGLNEVLRGAGLLHDPNGQAA